jgi:hypothetical protein
MADPSVFSKRTVAEPDRPPPKQALCERLKYRWPAISGDRIELDD